MGGGAIAPLAPPGYATANYAATKQNICKYKT